MNGYLRRLVTSAMRPSRAIHPLVGSVYAAPRSPAETAPIKVEEVSEPARPGESGQAAPARPHAAEAEGPLLPQQSQDAAIPVRARVGETTQLAARNGADSPNHAPREIAIRRDAQPNSEASVRRRMRAPEQQEAAPSDRVEITEVFDTPLLPTRAGWGASGDPLARATAHPAPVPAPGLLRPQAGTSRSPARPMQSAGAGQEPDEFQIHIGRIEVTAVPPPARAWPAAKQERKSLNLGDYLKERRGGNR